MRQVWDVDEPRSRQTDPETSHDAAASVRNRTETQEGILNALYEWGKMTDQELVDWYEGPKASPSGLRTRRAELVKMGKVRDSGQRVVLPSGRRAIVWEIAK
jgi:hypothetical protein